MEFEVHVYDKMGYNMSIYHIFRYSNKYISHFQTKQSIYITFSDKAINISHFQTKQ
jgi:hypothetical protein